jgi:DNA polymerase/3'-5' exonuclease PolX
MSDVEVRRPWRQLTPLAEWLTNVLQPACTEVVIAGSYRRESEAVGDIEIVVLPKWEMSIPEVDLFGDPMSEPEPCYPSLSDALEMLVANGLLVPYRIDGKLMKAFTVGPNLSDAGQGFEGQKIDMFIAKEDNFGNILVIRTGPADYSKRVVTAQSYGGMMPFGFRQEGGYLYNGFTKIPCRTEQDFYHAIGKKWVSPTNRH